MANEDKKDFNAKMKDSKNMPKIVELNEVASVKRGGKTLVVAAPLEYNELMAKVPEGKIITIDSLRKKIAKQHNVDITCPLTAGIFTNICARASHQRKENKIPYRRTIKSDGSLNSKYPGGIEFQKEKLEQEGHKIIAKGKNNTKYFVENHEKSAFQL